ncbi:hypothetical protein ACJ41O_012730 [Fusarium nematophilum]
MLRWALIAVLARSASAICYYPDGSNAAKDYNYLPCSDTNTTYSTCCYFGEGDTCLQNGLCNMPGKFDYRAACQNKDWSNCPEICMDTETGTWLPLNKCGDSEYCCPTSAGSDCCDNGSQTTKLKAPEPDSGSNGGIGASDSASEAASSDEAASTGDPTSSGFVSVIRTTIVSSSDPTAGSSGGFEKAPVPAGAIAGGVVGGIAVIGILVLVGFGFFKRQGNKPSIPPGGATAVVTGAGGSNGSNSSDGEKEKPVVYQKPQAGIPEIEGSAGNEYWEADSQAISPARFAVRKEADQAEEETQQAEGGKPANRQSQQQQQPQWLKLSEIEGSAGHIYTEADSQAISAARFAEKQRAEEAAWRQAEEENRQEELVKQQKEQPAAQLQHQVTIEGSRGDGYTDVDPQIVSAFPFYLGSNQHALFSHTTVQEKLPLPQAQRPGPADIQGSSDNIYTETDLQATGAAGLAQGQQAQVAAQSATETKPAKLQGQQVFTEVEGTPGNLCVKADTLVANPFWPSEAKPDAQVPTNEKPAKHQGQKQTLTETESSTGNAYLEADSQVVDNPARPAGVRPPQLQGAAEAKPTSHHGQQKVSVQAPGSSGNENLVALPHVVDPNPTGETKQDERPANLQGVQAQQQSLVEPEASVGLVTTVPQATKPTQPLEMKPVGSEKPTKAQRVQTQHHILAEAEGSVSNVYTVVDSQPPQAARPLEINLDEEKPTSPQAQEQGLSEVTGNLGNIYTEADSKPVATRPIATKPVEQWQANLQGQGQVLVGAESPGILYSEADSQPANTPCPSATRPDHVGKATEIQERSLVEVEGSAGSVYFEADSQATLATSFTQSTEHYTVVEENQSQFNLVEVEESPGAVYMEADSKPIRQARLVETKRVTGGVQELEGKSPAHEMS